MEDFVDVSKERNFNVWNFFLWNKRDEKAKCKTCGTVLKCKNSSTKSLFEHFKRIHSKEIGKEKESLPIQAKKMTDYLEKKSKRSLEEVVTKLAIDGITSVPPPSLEPRLGRD